MNSKLSIEDIQAEKWFRNILDNKLYEKMKYIYKVSLMNNENIENLEKISNEKINYEKKQFEEKLKQYEEKLKENEDQYKQYKFFKKFESIVATLFDLNVTKRPTASCSRTTTTSARGSCRTCGSRCATSRSQSKTALCV